MRFLLILFLGFFATAQNNSIQSTQIDSLNLPAIRYCGTDGFSNHYTIEKNSFYKTGNTKTVTYKNYNLGPLETVDILNPLEIVLFYKQFNTVVKVDNNLNEISSINFNTLSNAKNISHVANAGALELWVIDENTLQLQLFSYTSLKAKNISQPILEDIIAIAGNYNFCWVLTSKHLYQYNKYGSLLETHLLEVTANQLQQFDGNIVIQDASGLKYLKKGGNEFQYISKTNNSIKDFFLQGDSLYIYNGKLLFRYQLQINN